MLSMVKWINVHCACLKCLKTLEIGDGHYVFKPVVGQTTCMIISIWNMIVYYRSIMICNYKLNTLHNEPAWDSVTFQDSITLLRHGLIVPRFHGNTKSTIGYNYVEWPISPITVQLNSQFLLSFEAHYFNRHCMHCLPIKIIIVDGKSI